MLRSPEQSRAVFFRSHESVREQVIRPCRQFTCFLITVDTITLFFNMLQLPRAAVKYN